MKVWGRISAFVLVLGLAGSAYAADRTADEIVKELEGIARPKTPSELKEGNKKRADLIGELVKNFPDDSRVTKLLPSRWGALSQLGEVDTAVAEINKTVAETKDETFRTFAMYLKAQILLNNSPAKPSKAAQAAIDDYLKAYPKDQRGPALLYMTVMRGADPAEKKLIEDRILKDYESSPYAEMIKSKRKQDERVGKPFELEFTEAIKGTTISMKSLKGKVVVIDFWATWCGPCVAEMPKMKELYAEYKDKGVEFIGISLDQPKEAGGLNKLKDFVAKNEITWPQYYQGNGWKSEFSSEWGINSIPCVFIIDADGNLATNEARGKLEKLIPELLAKKGKSSPSTNE